MGPGGGGRLHHRVFSTLFRCSCGFSCYLVPHRLYSSVALLRLPHPLTPHSASCLSLLRDFDDQIHAWNWLLKQIFEAALSMIKEKNESKLNIQSEDNFCIHYATHFCEILHSC